MAIAQWEMFTRSACRENGRDAAREAIRLDPMLAAAHAALGAALEAEGQYAEGLEACQAALRIDPVSYEGNRIAGMCSMAMHRFDDAIRYFEAAAADIETEFTCAALVTQMHEAKGDRPGAIAAGRRALARIEKVIAAEPDHGRALGYGAGVLAILREADRAKEWIERGALLDPNNTLLLYNFLCALSRLGEYDDALELLSRIIDKSSQGMLLWFENDTDLDALRETPRFVELLSKAKARFAAG
jgi:adenylate cyclase